MTKSRPTSVWAKYHAERHGPSAAMEKPLTKIKIVGP